MDSAYNSLGGIRAGKLRPVTVGGEILIILCKQVTCIQGESTNDWGYMWGLLGGLVACTVGFYWPVYAEGGFIIVYHPYRRDIMS